MEHFICFLKVNTGEKMWIYMLGKFIHDSYAGEWYNGQLEQTPEYIGNKVSMLIGMPRLRQLRIQEGKSLCLLLLLSLSHSILLSFLSYFLVKNIPQSARRVGYGRVNG